MKSDDTSESSSLREIYLRALGKKSVGERNAFLDGACGDDQSVRSKVEALLQENADDSFLEIPAAEMQATIAGEISEGPGSAIGRYKLLQQIGEGGMGVVYMAEQTEPVIRKVALKIIKLGMDTKQVVARFEAERQALAMMDHPNIAKVLDAGATDTGRPYFVMELVHGIPITQFCDESDLTIEERLDLFLGVCSAIQHAHQKGIIHRDIKPSNVMVTLHDDKPVPLVIDFGIAKAIQQRLTEKTLFTNYSQFVGTPAYVSPEQAQMSGLDIDTRSDIYSLGVLLYELMTGRTPLNGAELINSGIDEIRRRIREEEPPKPSTRISTLMGEELTRIARHRRTDPDRLRWFFRGDLDRVVMKTLEKDRTRRYDTAKGLANDIRRYLNHEPVEAMSPGMFYRANKFIVRHRVMVALVSLVTLVLVAGTIVSVWQAFRATRASELEHQAREDALRALETAQMAEQRASTEGHAARLNLYASNLLLAEQAIDSSNLGRARELLERHDPALNPTPGPDLRDWEWYWLKSQLASGTGELLATLPGSVFGLSLSHDGKFLAATTLAGHLKILDARSGRELMTLEEGGGMPMKPRFFPSDNRLIYNQCKRDDFQTSGELKIWNLDKRQEEQRIQLPYCVGPKSVNASGTQAIYYSPLDNYLRLMDFQTETIRWNVLLPQNTMYGSDNFRFSGVNDEEFIIGIATGELRVCSASDGKVLRAVQAHPNFISALALSPDGRTIVSAAGYAEKDIRVWDYLTLKQVGRLEGHQGWVCDICFTSDGKRLVSASSDQTVRMWDLETRQELAVYRGVPQEVWEVELTPDDRVILAGGKDGSIYRWDATIQPTQTSLLVATNVTRLALSDDGSRMAVLSGDSSLMLGRIGSQIQLDGISFGGTNNSFVQLSGDGRLILVGRKDGAVSIYDAASRKERCTIPVFDSTVLGAEFLDSTNSIVVADKNHHLARVDCSLSGDPVLWRSTLDEIGPIRSFNVLAVSPDKRLALQKNWFGAFMLFDIDSGEELQSARNPSSQADILDQAFSLDGSLLATADGSGVIGLWDVATFKRESTLEGHRGSSGALVFLPGERRLVSGGTEDDAIIIWDLESRQELLRLSAPGRIVNLKFSPAENLLLGVTAVGNLYAWRAPPG